MKRCIQTGKGIALWIIKMQLNGDKDNKGNLRFYVLCRNSGVSYTSCLSAVCGSLFSSLCHILYSHADSFFDFRGVFAILIIWELRSMFRTVLNGDCFVKENVRSLKRMGNDSFCIAAVSAVRLLIVITPATLVIILVFIIAGLFSKVLSNVF